MLGGVAHYGPDREFAGRLLAACPGILDAVRENRRFLRRALGFLVEQGIRQFLDLGAGIPSHGCATEVARSAAPDSRVVSVDIDPVAISLAEDAFQNHEDVAVIEADLREPDALLRFPELTRLLDLDQPTALLMLATPHLLHDDDRPAALIEHYRGWLAPGSYLVLSHATDEGISTPGALREHCADMVTFRDKRQIAELVDKFEPVEPGIVRTSHWRPERDAAASGDPEDWAVVARKP